MSQNFKDVYSPIEVEALRLDYDDDDIRTWPFYPAPINGYDEIEYEVWDQLLLGSHYTTEYLWDAIKEARKMNREVFNDVQAEGSGMGRSKPAVR